MTFQWPFLGKKVSSTLSTNGKNFMMNLIINKYGYI